MNQALITLRLANMSDAPAIAELHRASIRHYCTDHYPPDVIEEWVLPLKASDYQNLAPSCTLMVAEASQGLVGFALLDSQKGTLEKLYIAPGASRQGIGSALLHQLETQAYLQGIQDLNVSATLNAISFYERHAYQKKSLTPAARAKDNMLGCISMFKHLGPHAL